jgi:peptidyl-dipeptidase Dcp
MPVKILRKQTKTNHFLQGLDAIDNFTLMNNPLLGQWDTPFATPPFPEFNIAHFKPAIEEAIKYAAEEINSITANTDPPTFDNTISLLEKAGEKLDRISAVLFNLNNAETSKELQSVAQDVSPLLTRFSNDITLNEKLFERISGIFENRDLLNLSVEQKILVEKMKIRKGSERYQKNWLHSH